MALLSLAEAEERPRFLGAALGFVCVASASLIARTAGDTLFLSRFGREFLPYMYVGTAALLTPLSSVYGFGARRYPLNRVISFACWALATLSFGLWAVLATTWDGFRVVAYFVADITVYGSMLLFWSFFGQTFDSREAKRLIGMVEAGGTAACILAGFLIRPLILLMGDRGLFIVVGALVLGFAFSVSWVSHDAFRLAFPRPGAEPGAARASSLASFRQLLNTPQVRTLALLVLAATISVTLVEFQFKSAAGLRYQNQLLAAFFGEFYGGANIAVLVIQLFVVHRLLRRFNLALILSLMPAGLLAGSLGVIVSAAFGWIVFMRLTVQTASFTIDNAARQILFLGIRSKSRNQARALVDGICIPAAVGTTGIVLALVPVRIPIHALACGVTVLAVAWLYLARRNYVFYLRGLIDSLGSKLLDLPAAGTPLYDRTLVTCTRKALLSAGSKELPHLFSIIETLGQVDWIPEVRRLLESDNPDARTAALRYLERHGTGKDYPGALRRVSDPAPEVREAALGAIARTGGRQAVAALSESLGDPAPGVRVEAAAGLMQVGDPTAVAAAGNCLRRMVASGRAADRIAVARHLGSLQFDGWKRLFFEFMQDPDKSVRVAALEACSTCQDPELIPSLIRQLSDSATCAAAADALSAFGRSTLEFLKTWPGRAELRTLLAGAGPLAAVLVRIGGEDALKIVLELFDTPENLDSARLIETCCRLLNQQPSPRPYLALTSTMASWQMAEAKKRLESLRRVSTLIGVDFLRRALEEEYSRHLHNLFLILDARKPGTCIRNMHSVLIEGTSENRAAALEVLENVLPGSFKSPVLRLLEQRGAGGRDHDGRSEVLEMLRPGTSDWVLAGAVHAAGENKMAEAVEPMRRLLSHPNANVAKTARRSLARIGSSGPSRTRAQHAGPGDGCGHIGHSAAESNQLEGQEMMILDKILFLRRVPLFSRMATEQLGRLAGATSETVYPAASKIIAEGEPGDRLFLVVDGEVLIHRGDARLATLRPEDCFGEMSVIDGEPRSASATAVTDCLVLVLRQQDFKDILSANADVAWAVIRTLSRRLRETIINLQQSKGAQANGSPINA